MRSSSSLVAAVALIIPLACSSAGPTAPFGEGSNSDTPNQALGLASVSGPIGGPSTQAKCTYETCPGGGTGGSPPLGTGIRISGVTMTRCTSLAVSGIDSDSDGLDDECEYQIASKFAPRLIFEANDYARGRETYWASHRKYACGGWYTTDGLHAYCSGYIWVIRVAYLLGYYSDGGPQAHKGDSEFLILEAA